MPVVRRQDLDPSDLRGPSAGVSTGEHENTDQDLLGRARDPLELDLRHRAHCRARSTARLRRARQRYALSRIFGLKHAVGSGGRGVFVIGASAGVVVFGCRGVGGIKTGR